MTNQEKSFQGGEALSRFIIGNTLFGKRAFEVEKILENQGIYAEFCDGEALTALAISIRVFPLSFTNSLKRSVNFIVKLCRKRSVHT